MHAEAAHMSQLKMRKAQGVFLKIDRLAAYRPILL